MKKNSYLCDDRLNIVHNTDAYHGLQSLSSGLVDCIITSPLYFQLRDYGCEDQIGLEKNVNDYIDKLVVIFHECKRVLKNSGTLFIVIGDSYNSGKKSITDNKKQYLNGYTVKGRIKDKKINEKCLIMVPARLAIALIDDGWILRNKIIWKKPNAMPQSAKDRFTIDYEEILFLTKSKKYYFHQLKEPMKTKDKSSPRGSKAVFGELNNGLRQLRKLNRTISAKKQDEVGRNDYQGFNERYEMPDDLMRNKRCIWEIPTAALRVKHFAVFPKALVEPMILAGCPENGVVLDPFAGSGTAPVVAKELKRNFIGIELNSQYVEIANKRLLEGDK